MRTAVRRARTREVGGILMAEQLEQGRFRLADFTVDSQTGSAAHFVRSVGEHGAALQAFFESTGADYARFNYLGEWHSHPNHLPVPSREDAASMQELVEGERGIPFAVLLVVRASWRSMLLSATLFEAGAGPTPITVEDGRAPNNG